MGYVTRGELADRHNVDPLVSKLAAAAPSASRSPPAGDLGGELRRRIGLKALMAAAGITCSQRLGDVVASLPPASEQEMVALLGATS